MAENFSFFHIVSLGLGQFLLRQSMHALHLAHFCWGQLSGKRKLHILYLSRKAHFVLMFFHQNIVTTAFGMLFLIKNYHRYFHKIRNNGLFAKYFPSVQKLSLVINPNHELMILQPPVMHFLHLADDQCTRNLVMKIRFTSQMSQGHV